MPLLTEFAGVGLSSYGFTRSAGAAAGSYELISTAFGTGSSGVITFSSIPTTTYKHLQLRAVTKTNFAGDASTAAITLNGDTAANYSWHVLRGTGGSVQSLAQADASNAPIYALGTTTANAPSVSIIDILDAFSTTKNKTIRQFEGYVSSGVQTRLSSAAWRSISAVTSITITAGSSASFTSLTRFSLYGIKGA